MSYEATAWALKQQVRPSARLLLAHMADVSMDGLTCFMSVGTMAKVSGLDRKTVITALQQLIAAGCLVDTEERKGSTGQIVVYGLVREAAQNRNGTESGTVPISDAKSPGIPAEDSQFSLESVPKTGHGDSKESGKRKQEERPRKGEQATTLSRDAIGALFKNEVQPQAVADWEVVRKATKAGSITPTVAKILRREAERASVSLQDAVEACCEYGWKNFNAGWYAERTATVKRPGAAFGGGRSVLHADEQLAVAG